MIHNEILYWFIVWKDVFLLHELNKNETKIATTNLSHSQKLLVLAKHKKSPIRKHNLLQKFRATRYMGYITNSPAQHPLPPPRSATALFSLRGTRKLFILLAYFIAQSERHFAKLIRINFMLYNRNFAQQTRQRVVLKTSIKYAYDKLSRTESKLIQRKWANNISTRARFVKGRLPLIS